MPVLRSDFRRRRYSLDFLFLLHQGKRKREINILNLLFPLERFFSVPLLQRDFVSRCSRHTSGTTLSCIKAKEKEKDKQPFLSESEFSGLKNGQDYQNWLNGRDALQSV